MSELVIFTGCPGAGKSTAGELFAQNSLGTWAYIDQDEVRKQIKAGFKNPGQSWDEQTQLQWDVSVDICADMARRYQAADINVLLDCFMPPHAYDTWQLAFEGLSFKVAVLLPTPKRALERNAERNGTARLPDEMIVRHHEWFSGYIGDSRVKVIDSTDLSPQEVVSALSAFCMSASVTK